jgi:hypothetical protein
VFSGSTQLDAHVINAHAKTDSNRFRCNWHGCPLMDKKFRDFANLVSHLR